MKAWINRLISRNTPQPRKYQVPDGWFADRVVYLYDKFKTQQLQQTKRALWKLIEERCLEVRKGQWEVVVDGSGVFVEEVLQ